LEGLLKVGVKGEIDYTRLEEILSDEYSVRTVRFDQDEESRESIKLEAGSLGDWLQRASCPAEIQNYKRLIFALEAFEKESGMSITTTREGLSIPLGPDLRAKLSFSIH
jgi:hypothetical protein